MPDKGSLIGLAEQSKRECREHLRDKINMVIDEALQDGFEPHCVAEALMELADEHMDAVVDGLASHFLSVRLH
jgi:hypothetical protein